MAGADGGAGDDTFVTPDGNDTITDFNASITAAIGDGDPTNTDFVDLSDHCDSLDVLKADHADDGILTQSNTLDNEGKTVDHPDNQQFDGDSLTMHGATADSFHPGPMSMKMMGRAARTELSQILRELALTDAYPAFLDDYGATARAFLRRKQVCTRLRAA